MKVLVCVSVVVLLVAGVQAQPPRRGRHDPIRTIRTELCPYGTRACRECIRDNKPERITTEEQLDELKINLEECSTGNFSELTLEMFQTRRRGPPFDPADHGVAEDDQVAMFKCVMEKDGTLAAITDCINESSS